MTTIFQACICNYNNIIVVLSEKVFTEEER